MLNIYYLSFTIINKQIPNYSIMGFFKKLRRFFYSSETLSLLNRKDDSNFKLKSLQQYQCSHKQPQLPFVIKDETCHTCSSTQCYICSQNHHIPNSCQVKLSKLIYPPLPSYDNKTHIETLRMFNFGQVGKLNLNGLKCICGKPWGKGFAICAVCGMVSCSKECHIHWERKGYCNFHNLFRKEHNQQFDMRSILHENIEYAVKKKTEPGTQLNLNKSKFITCFSSEIPTQVYLQRGYRIYGHPNESLLDNLTIVPKNIDYHLHLDRICDCGCQDCKKGYHSVGMCTSPCIEDKLEKMKQSLERGYNEQVCECQCDFCNSGEITKGKSHTVYDCLFECKEEQNKEEKENEKEDEEKK